VDDLQSNGQYERSLPLIEEIEANGSPADRAEALFHHARTLDVALRRPAQALELYRRYVNAHPDGPRAREAYVRIRMIENQ
jgi:tetratricopeptide (TPR) repeat protein